MRVWAFGLLSCSTQIALKEICSREPCAPLTKHEEVARVGDVDKLYDGKEPVGSNAYDILDKGAG